MFYFVYVWFLFVFLFVTFVFMFVFGWWLFLLLLRFGYICHYVYSVLCIFNFEHLPRTSLSPLIYRNVKKTLSCRLSPWLRVPPAKRRSPRPNSRAHTCTPTARSSHVNARSRNPSWVSGRGKTSSREGPTSSWIFWGLEMCS